MKIHEITIGGKIEIDAPIDKDTEYSIALERIQQDEGKMNLRVKDDSSIMTYKMVSLGNATLIAEGEVIKGKSKKGSPSQALRIILKKLWEEQHAGEIDEETFYRQEMDKIIQTYRDRIL